MKESYMIEITPANLIQIVFSIQTIFFSIIAYRQELKVFSLLLITFACHMILNYLIEANFVGSMFDITSAFGFAYGPLFYFYLLEITQSRSNINLSTFKYSIPFILALPFSPAGLVFNILVLCWSLYFIIKIIMYLKTYSLTIETSISDVDSARLLWLKKIFIFIIVVFIYDIARSLLYQYTNYINSNWYYLVTLITAFLSISALAVYSFQFKQRFEGVSKKELNNQMNCPDEHFEITEHQQQIIRNALVRLEKDQLYLNPQLRLSDFAKAVDIDSRELSSLLFVITKKRFPKHTMILRVEHAKMLIKESINNTKSINLLNLSYQSGFNAKSSFNLAFKQITGMTPSQYIQQNKN